MTRPGEIEQLVSIAPMLKFPLQVGQKGIVHPLMRHVLDGIVFRDGVVELDGVGVFILVGKKGLKERQLLRT